MQEHAQDGMLERLRSGDVRALARAVSMVEDGAAGMAELLAGCERVLLLESARRARKIGITGPPGAGKSTLVDALVRELRRRGETVGVVAVDPSSPYTGGALLGDRIRMQGFTGDDGVYIRSMASRGAMGGLTRTAAQVCRVMEAAGRQTILIETVGVGQDEVEIAGLADVTVLVLVPGLGDDVQSLKAGVMEVADIFVVNKADLPGADAVEHEILAMQSLAGEHGSWIPPVVRTVASSGEGIAGLIAAVEAFLAARPVRLANFPRLPAEFQGLALDHLGIAVRSIAASRGFYELLGARVTHEETVKQEQVRTAMLPFGQSRVELLEPTTEDSTIGRFLANRGEGLHHVALRVADLDAQFHRLSQAGVRLVSERIGVGAGGHRYFFVHPASTGGVLVELVGD